MDLCKAVQDELTKHIEEVVAARLAEQGSGSGGVSPAEVDTIVKESIEFLKVDLNASIDERISGLEELGDTDVQQMVDEAVAKLDANLDTATVERLVTEYLTTRPGEKTVLDYGAAPTGNTDSSAAFQAAADDNTASIIVPNSGVFQINAPVMIRGSDYEGGSTRARRKPIIGSSYNAFGGQFDRSSIVPGPDLEGAMFSGAFIVKGISFHGNGKEGVYALELDAYEDEIDSCTFGNFDIAINCYQPVGNVYRRNNFTGCSVAINHWGDAAATITRFEHNYFMGVKDCIKFEGEAHGLYFLSNTFERVTGVPIQALSLIDGTYISNWFEHTDHEDENGELVKQAPIVTTSPQQIQASFSAGNHCQSGFINIFADDTHSGRVGGVVTDKGSLIVRDPTGSAARLKNTGLFQELDDWAGKTDFTFQAGRAHAAQRTSDFVWRNGYGGGHVYETYDTDGSTMPFSGAFKYRLKDNLLHEVKPSSYFGMLGITDKGANGTINTSTPAMMRWSAVAERSRNLDVFTTVEFADGVLTLSSSGGLIFKNPVAMFQAYGAEIESIEKIEPYERPTWDHCKGWKLTFKDGAQPTEVHISLTCYEA